MSSIVPKKLAIYYSWPSAVNSAGGDVNAAVAAFKDYELVVFGAGLEQASHGDHANTVAIINHPDMANTEVYGYIDSTLPTDEIQDKLELWGAMGVSGIFLDQFGYDFGVNREKQRALVWSIHHLFHGTNRLKAFVNAWNPDHAFSSAVDATYNPSGKATRLDGRDWYLAESFCVKNGAYDDDDLNANGVKDWQDKATRLTGSGGYRSVYGTNVAAVATNDDSAFDQNKADYSYCAAVANKFDAWGWGEQFFSASSAQMPMRSRAPVSGTRFTGAINYVGGVLERQTNVGVHIDTNTHTVSNLLN